MTEPEQSGTQVYKILRRSNVGIYHIGIVKTKLGTQSVVAGTLLIREGDIIADYMYSNNDGDMELEYAWYISCCRRVN